MKREILIASLVIIAQTLTANFAQAQDKSGSEIGKGENGVSTTHIYNSNNGGSRADLYDDINEEANDGVPDRYDDDLDGGHRIATRVLQEALEHAHDLFNDGDVQGARNRLTQGLSEALQIFDPKLREKPLLQNAIQRGLRLNSVFQNACPAGDQGCLTLEKEAAIYFLNVYYKYILNTVTSLDVNYYIPYITRHQRHCRSFDCFPEDYGYGFFINYRDAAIALLDFYNGHNSGLPDALARNIYELRLAELVLRWAADDLNSDLFRRHFGCAIDELDQASLAIAKFNAGDKKRSRFRNSTRAVKFAREKSENVAYALGAQNSCIVYPNWRRP